MQTRYSKGKLIVKVGKQEIGWIENMIGMMRHLHASTGDPHAKAAADALEHVEEKYKPRDE